MIKQYKDFVPEIGKDTFVAETAVVIGDVKIGEECSIWYGSVVRGDVNKIRIGNRTNIQDCSCVHTRDGEAYCVIGDDVTIGHNVCVHGCRIKDKALIGMGATVLDMAEIGYCAVVAAGALVLSNTKIGDYELWGGVPAKFIKKLSQADVERIITVGIEHYVEQAHIYNDPALVKDIP